MLKRLGYDSNISKDAEEIAKADKLILPGVGHFDHGMRQLKNSGLIEVLGVKALEEKIPFLGICLGAQLLGKGSEEGNEAGLAWLDMDVVNFDRSKLSTEEKVPHMGWNYIEQMKDSDVLSDLPEDPRFYFVHSFHMKPNDDSIELCRSNYGYDFTSAVAHDNIYGMQFHPEKSHKFGMKLLDNFASL